MIIFHNTKECGARQYKSQPALFSRIQTTSRVLSSRNFRPCENIRDPGYDSLDSGFPTQSTGQAQAGMTGGVIALCN